MTSLLDLAAERRALEALLVESGGEMPPGSALEARWNECADALIAKVDAYALLTIDWEAQAQRMRELAKEAKARADALESARERLLERASMAMGPDCQELKGDAFRLVRRQNPPSVTILDESAVVFSCPDAVTVVPSTTKIDKRKVAEALKRNPDAVRGAVLTTSERIEVKP